MSISLADAKLHLRVDHDDEDAAITAMIGAAEQAAADYLNIASLSELEDSNADIPQPVMAAVLMLVGALYMNRESQSDRPIIENRLFTRLLDPYRQMEA